MIERELKPLDDRSDPQTYAIIGAAMEVHTRLGSGFLEAVYHAALAIELGERRIPFRTEILLPIRYKGRELACNYRVDFICFESVLVELKALQSIGAAERAQIINYLRAADIHRGLLLNFGTGKLEFERFVVGYSPAISPSASSASSVDKLWSPTTTIAAPQREASQRG